MYGHAMVESMLDPAVLAPERIRPLMRREYERLVELGVFEDERVELLRGQLVEMSPQGEAHSTLTARIATQLIRAIDPERYDVRSHSPYAATDDSEPEPDVSVSLRKKKRAYHPSQALLLVEVAESSLRKDRVIKAGIYAENNAPEYWIVDVRSSCVYVYSHPLNGEYTVTRRLRRGHTLRPLHLDVSISVSSLFGR